MPKPDAHIKLRPSVHTYTDNRDVRMHPPADADPQEILRSADGLPLKIHGRGLMRIINSSSAHDKLTRWAQWADAIVLTNALYPSYPPWTCSAAAAVNCTSVTQPHSDGLDIQCCGWGPLLRVGQKASRSRGLADWQWIWDRICPWKQSWMRICGQNPRTDVDVIFRDSHNSDRRP